ncbi:hypothetical protein TEA_011545 [Camellia sinensis var. sinensis]|uniref:RNase H type-1 domain-containing protein n=1 Tax=Camellia sinensis var. sinensis TaxID=542762 RepID=A0A4S4EZW7_CAMSN|nr:hypothetical protein TEA_011545 [Camellia sinensis var. sinensis]
MEDEKDAFYVVKKGDIVGVYKSLNDCQALLGSSVCDPSVSVFKGYCLPKEAENYLGSHGLKNAVYSIGATNVQDDLFGQLAVCPFQQPASSKGKALDNISPVKRLQHGVVGSSSIPAIPQSKQAKLQNFIEAPALCGHIPSVWLANEYPHSSNAHATKVDHVKQASWNPGLAGAGAMLRADDGSMVCRLREGVGIATNNVAEYRAVILGLRYALKKGFKHVRVQGDSKLVYFASFFFTVIMYSASTLTMEEKEKRREEEESEREKIVLVWRWSWPEMGKGKEKCNHPFFAIFIPEEFCNCHEECSPIDSRLDSKILAVQGLWKIKNPNMAALCKVAKELKDKFMSFEIRHVEREFNSAADAQANLAVYLKDGEVEAECDIQYCKWLEVATLLCQEDWMKTYI